MSLRHDAISYGWVASYAVSNNKSMIWGCAAGWMVKTVLGTFWKEGRKYLLLYQPSSPSRFLSFGHLVRGARDSPMAIRPNLIRCSDCLICVKILHFIFSRIKCAWIFTHTDSYDRISEWFGPISYICGCGCGCARDFLERDDSPLEKFSVKSQTNYLITFQLMRV